MIKRILDPSWNNLLTLKLYIIAASFPRMLKRMNRPASKCYYDRLVELKSKAFDFPDLPHTASTNLNDKLFLGHLTPLSKIFQIPNLVTASKDMERPCEIYNKQTYMEFHILLCTLLDRFTQSLHKLEAYWKQICKLSDSDKPVSDSLVINIRRRLDSVLATGNFLRAMVSGAAMEKHLKTIAHLLELNDGKLWTTTEADTDVDDPTEQDTDFDALKPFSIHHGEPLLPWQSFRDWLKLIIIYFDAATILNDYVNKSSITDIDIKILAHPFPSREMLPWKDLLRHKTYFPEPTKLGEPSAEELISFLTSDFDVVTEGSWEKDDIQDILAEAKRFHGLTGVQLDEAIVSVTEKMSLIENCSFPGWKEYSSTIRAQLQNLKKSKLTRDVQLVHIRLIVELLESWKGHSALFWKLKEGSPLSLGKGFSGTRHCEVCIASLINQPRLGLSQHEALVLSEFGVSHIFMLYSNVCLILQYRKMDSNQL
jgi:hypothetical protein